MGLWYVNGQSEVSQNGVQNHESDRMATRTKRKRDETSETGDVERSDGTWRRIASFMEALMRRYCLERHRRLRKLFLRGNNYVTSREYTRHCPTLWNSTTVFIYHFLLGLFNFKSFIKRLSRRTSKMQGDSCEPNDANSFSRLSCSYEKSIVRVQLNIYIYEPSYKQDTKIMA